MKKFLPYTPENTAKVEALPKVYIVAVWAHYGVREYAFTGKFDKNGEPLVYNYDDHNGTHAEWVLTPISYVTTGWIQFWTFSKEVADKCAHALRVAEEGIYE